MAQTSKVSGIVQIDGTPAPRTVRAFGYEARAHTIDGKQVNLSRSLGQATSDPNTGEYTIDLLAGYARQVFVVAFDDYGASFQPDMALAVGDRVHPSTPNGYVWECAGAGTLPSEEPAWVIDTETAQLYGTASMIARPFYRPMVHGPVAPEVTLVGDGDPHWDKVVSLLHFDGGFSDEISENTWSVSGSGITTTEVTSVFGGALRSEGEGGSRLGIENVLPLRMSAGQDFTIELFAYIDPSAATGHILNTYTGTTGSNLILEEIGEELSVYTETQSSINTGLPFNRGQWHHVALVRDSGEVTPFVDGIKGVGWLYSGPYNFDTFRFLVWTYRNRAIKGGIDEFRITKGVARYTENFTPPTGPFPNFAPEP